MRWWRIGAVSIVALALAAFAMHRFAPRPSDAVHVAARMDRITLERTACFGPCPVYTVTIERDGRATFEATPTIIDPRQAMRHSTLAWHAQVPAPSMRALIAAVESDAYAALDSDYSIDVTDHATTTLSVQGGGQIRSTRVYAVPCRAQAAGKTRDPSLKDTPLVPDIFCNVAELVDVASCARYWGVYSVAHHTTLRPARPRIPPRCTPTP